MTVTTLGTVRRATARPGCSHKAGRERVCEESLRPLGLSGPQGRDTDGGPPDSR
jgi:hypothetical protein